MRPLVCLIVGATLPLWTGCATLVSSNTYRVVMDNPPAPTTFTVLDRKNQPIASGVTPNPVELRANAFPFWPAKYSVVFNGVEGHSQRHEVNAKLDPWVAGNILLGGGAGALIDGATGAAFRLPDRVSGTVSPQFAMTAGGPPSQTQQPLIAQTPSSGGGRRFD